MQRQIPVLEGYLRPADLAKEIGISVRTVSRWQVRRIGPPRVVVGKQVFYKLASVLSWLESREQRQGNRQSRS